ncbi:MAG: hypothetical protein ISP10_09905 [Aeromicrobium sp.]|nr:hypothetical protein [Aeromicrobium sp.]
MKYTRFEALVFILGSAAILATLVLAPSQSQSAEVVAQLLLIPILGAALHWGRSGGFLAAVLATGVYVAMRAPLLYADGFTSDAIALIGIRVAAYSMIGIIGGEVATRLKYALTGLGDKALVEPETGAYSAAYAARAIRVAIASWDRYQAPYSVVRLDIAGEFLSARRPAERRKMLRQTAGALRGDIRLVDDLAHAGDGRFLMLLPNTDAEGAATAATRLRQVAAESLDALTDAIRMTVLSSVEHRTELALLAEALEPTTADGPGGPTEETAERRA